MEWTHSICAKCWIVKFPERNPVTVLDGEEEICCWCGGDADAGIYLRSVPADLACEH